MQTTETLTEAPCAGSALRRNVMPDLQSVPYDDLCGCVAVTLTPQECAEADRADDYLPRSGQAVVERVIRSGRRERIPNAECLLCYGSGFAA
jgi:hypothetical protein